MDRTEFTDGAVIDGSEPFVDRIELMGELRALARDVVSGHGRTAIVEGVSGMGKTALLREFARVELECRVVSVACTPVIGPGIPDGLIRRVAGELIPDSPAGRNPSTAGRATGMLARGAAAAVPDVLSLLIPGGGAVYAAGKAMVKASIGPGTTRADSFQPFSRGQAQYIAEGLIATARDDRPVLLLIDDIQECDPSSLDVLSRMMENLHGAPLGVVVTHALDGSRRGSPSSILPLLDEWARIPRVRRFRLEGLPPEAIDELVRRTRGDAPDSLSRELHELTDGHAVFVTMCLNSWRPDAGPGLDLPRGLDALVEERLSVLDHPGREQDRDIITTAAVQGETFLSDHVAQAAAVSHDVVLSRLAAMAREGQLVRPASESDLPEWADADDADTSDIYRFEHRALRHLVHDKQSRTQKKLRHGRLARLLAYDTVRELPLARRVAIAEHLRAGGRDCLVESAQVHYDLAFDAAVGRQVGSGNTAAVVGGLSFEEAEQHCTVAIDAAQRITDRQEPRDRRDRRLIDAIELLLSLTEVRWRGTAHPAGGADVDPLAEQAEAAADRIGDTELRIRTTMQRGKTLLATRGVAPALEKLGEAVRMAQAHGDATVEFIARVEYGRQLPKKNLAAGLDELRRAEQLYETIERGLSSGDPILENARNLGEMQLGINLYDSGEIGEALDRIRRCVDRLRSERFSPELPIALNYLAQVSSGLGMADDAERALRQALAVEEERGGDSGWHAYNQALLARHLLEHAPGDGETALALAAAAWEETQRTWLINLVPIVRNLYAESLLLCADRTTPERARLDQADRLANDTVVETLETGMVRSRIAALSLRSRIHARLGNVDRAQAFARDAVRLLDETGDMPALRSEEVYYHAAVVLSDDAAAGHVAADHRGGIDVTGDGATSESAHLLRRARAEVERKAATIRDAETRSSFLTRVPLNAAIGRGMGN